MSLSTPARHAALGREAEPSIDVGAFRRRVEKRGTAPRAHGVDAAVHQLRGKPRRRIARSPVPWISSLLRRHRAGWRRMRQADCQPGYRSLRHASKTASSLARSGSIRPRPDSNMAPSRSATPMTTPVRRISRSHSDLEFRRLAEAAAARRDPSAPSPAWSGGHCWIAEELASASGIGQPGHARLPPPRSQAPFQVASRVPSPASAPTGSPDR